MNHQSKASIIWSIAGSDSGGGAGIQADLHTVHSFCGSHSDERLHLCTVITATTAQNSQGVVAINPVSQDALISQLMALADDMPAKVIKIGMLANVDQVKQVAACLYLFKQSWPTPPLVVYDPVAIASSGDSLTEQDILPAVIEFLLPVVDVLTPNSIEAQRFTGEYLISLASLPVVANKLLAYGCKAVIIKGGHLGLPKGYCSDYLHVSAEFAAANPTLPTPYHHQVLLSSPTQASLHHHGSGCSFASALSAGLALGYPLEDSMVLAKSYINQGISQSMRIGEGRGPLHHAGFVSDAAFLPKVCLSGQHLALCLQTDQFITPTIEFAPLSQPLGLYVVANNLALLTQALDLGVKTVQLRLKVENGAIDSQTEAMLKRDITAAIALAKQHNAQLFINDHWRLAIELGAYGVHLGQEDIDRADLEAISQAGLRLGVSSHGFYKLLRVRLLKPSYIAIGAIFATSTKDMQGKIQGISKLARLVPLFNQHPLVAIGGINATNIANVTQTGINSVAIVSAFSEAQDKAVSLALLNALLHAAKPNEIHLKN